MEVLHHSGIDSTSSSLAVVTSVDEDEWAQEAAPTSKKKTPKSAKKLVSRQEHSQIFHAAWFMWGRSMSCMS